MSTSAGDGPDSAAEDGKALVKIAKPHERTRSALHALLLIAAAFVVAGVLQQFGVSTLESAGMTEERAPIPAQIVPMALHFVGFFLVVGAYLAWRRDPSLARIDWPDWQDVRWILLGFAGLVALLVGLDVVLSQFGLEPADNVSVDVAMQHPELFLYFIPVVLFLNAPAEELLFRGVIQGLFRQSYGIVPGIVIAALLFGAVHYVALVGTGSRIAYVLIAFVSGLVLGALYEYTENLFVPIAVHACWNVLVYINLYAGAVGLL